ELQYDALKEKAFRRPAGEKNLVSFLTQTPDPIDVIIFRPVQRRTAHPRVYRDQPFPVWIVRSPPLFGEPSPRRLALFLGDRHPGRNLMTADPNSELPKKLEIVIRFVHLDERPTLTGTPVVEKIRVEFRERPDSVRYPD